MGTKKEPRRADTAIKEKNALLQRIAESVTDLGKKKYEQKSSKYLPASTIRVPPSVSGRGIPKTMKIDPAAPKAKYAGASREQEPALFEYYCGLGPQKRNFWRVAEYGGVSNATITFVAKKNKWVERVANFDSEVQKLINERIAEGLGELSQIEMARRAALISRHADIGQEPDWITLAQKEGNDVAFSKRLEWEDKSRKLDRAEQTRREESHRLIRQAISDRDNELAETYNTAWKDPAVRAKDYETIAKYAFDQGFSPEETALMTAPRYLSTLDKARKFDEAVAAGKLAKPGLVKKPAVLKPNARSPQTQSKNPQLQKELEAFNKNPTREGYLKVSNLSVVQ